MYNKTLILLLTSVTKVNPQEDDVVWKHEEGEHNDNNSQDLHDFMRFFLLIALKGIV